MDIAPHEWQGEPCPGAKMAPIAYQEGDDPDDYFNVLGDVDPEDREGDWDYNTEEYDLGEPTPWERRCLSTAQTEANRVPP